MKILLPIDNAILRESLRCFLNNSGYQDVEVIPSNQPGAIEQALTRTNPNLVILNWWYRGYESVLSLERNIWLIKYHPIHLLRRHRVAWLISDHELPHLQTKPDLVIARNSLTLPALTRFLARTKMSL